MLRASGFLALLISGAATSQAAVIYTSESAFNSALQGGAYTQDFSSLQPGGQTTTSSFPFSGSGISYTITTPTASDYFFVNGGVTGPWSLTTEFSGVTMTVNLSGGITAIGGLFSTTDFSEQISGESFLLTLSDGTTSTINSSVGGPATFRGFTTSGGTTITSLIIGGSTGGEFSTIHSLTVGYAAVPEPAVVGSVTAAGLIGLALVRRRLRRA